MKKRRDYEINGMKVPEFEELVKAKVVELCALTGETGWGWNPDYLAQKAVAHQINAQRKQDNGAIPCKYCKEPVRLNPYNGRMTIVTPTGQHKKGYGMKEGYWSACTPRWRSSGSVSYREKYNGNYDHEANALEILMQEVEDETD